MLLYKIIFFLKGEALIFKRKDIETRGNDKINEESKLVIIAEKN